MAIGGEGFCIIASETRLSAGYTIYTRNQEKLFELSPNTVLGCTGCWCDILTFTRIIAARMQVNFLMLKSILLTLYLYVYSNYICICM